MGIVDLGAIGKGGEAPRQGVQEIARVRGSVAYANDFELTLDPGGAIVIKFFFLTEMGVNEPTSVAMPIGRFLELCEKGPGIQRQLEAMIAAARKAQ